MSIDFEGLDNIIERFELLVNEEKYEAALKRACAVVERSAKQNAPKGRTGELRRSITSRIEGRGVLLQGVVYTPLLYAPYVEYGTGILAEGGKGRQDVPWSYQDERGEWHTTSGMPPHPYMRPALDDNREEILRIFREAIESK